MLQDQHEGDKTYVKMTIMKFKFLIILSISISASATEIRDLFFDTYANLDQQPKVIKSAEKPIEKKIIVSLAADSRLRARILKINEESVEIHGNDLFLKIDNAICLQRVVEKENHFGVHTICLREDYTLMDFFFKYLKENLG